MKWIEIIEIRSSYHSQKMIELKLKGLIEEIQKESSKQSIRIFSKVLLETDYVIMIQNDSKIIDHKRSQLGLRLSSALKEYGMIYHSIWNEIHSNKLR